MEPSHMVLLFFFFIIVFMYLCFFIIVFVYFMFYVLLYVFIVLCFIYELYISCGAPVLSRGSYLSNFSPSLNCKRNVPISYHLIITWKNSMGVR